MKKQPQQIGIFSAEANRYIANVQVKITIKHGEEIMDEYEDVIDLEFTNNTFEGQRNRIGFRALTTQKGYSTDEALFSLAHQAVEEQLQEPVTSLSYGKFV